MRARATEQDDNQNLWADTMRRFYWGALLFEQLAEADPSNAQKQSDLSKSYFKVGKTLAAQELTQKAVSALKNALEINKALVQRSPNPQWLADRDDIDRALEALQ
jgi:tetratricopeptide (TPR) repeat protein